MVVDTATSPPAKVCDGGRQVKDGTLHQAAYVEMCAVYLRLTSH